MSSRYAQAYVSELIEQAARDVGVTEPIHLGEIAPAQAKQPHIAVFMRLNPRLCVGTTAGLAARDTPLPVREGFQYFELCALTKFDHPQILWLLSNLGLHMLATSSPMLHGAQGDDPRPFLPYESVRLGDDGSQVLLVPRWRLAVPMGPPVEVVEPLPVSVAQWEELAPLASEERKAWVARMGARSVEQWEMLFAD